MPKGYVYEGESWQPLTYTLSDGPVNSIQTSNTDPKVGFDSTGLFITDANGNKILQITSDGLVIPASPSRGVSANSNLIQWLTQAIRLGYVNGYLNSGVVPGSYYGGIEIGSESHSGSAFESHLNVEAGDNSSLGRLWATVKGTGGFSTLTGGFGGVVDILDGDGYSSFVHNGNTATAPARPAPMKIRIGSVNMTWAGGSAVSNALTISHGLGRTPSAVVAIMTTSAFTQYAEVDTFSSTTFRAFSITTNGNPAAGITIGMWWIAIG